MTTKINPGCDFPPIPVPPGIEDFLKVLAAKLAEAQAKIAAVQVDPTGALLKALQNKRVTEAATRVSETTQAIIDQIDKYSKFANRLANINCPLPRVPDRKATGE